MRGPATTAIINGGGGGGSSSRRSRVFALVLAVGVVLTVVSVGFSVRWSSKTAFDGVSSVPVSTVKSGGGGGGSNGTNGDVIKSSNAGGVDRADRSDDGVGDDSVSDNGGVRPPDARWAGHGKRAYAVRAKKVGLLALIHMVVHVKPCAMFVLERALVYTHQVGN